jgi:hypothetical protein
MVEFKRIDDPNYQMERSGKIHQDVNDFMENDFASNIQITSAKSLLLRKKYKKLKKMRNKADYDFDIRINELEAEKQYMNCKIILQNIMR